MNRQTNNNNLYHPAELYYSKQSPVKRCNKKRGEEQGDARIKGGLPAYGDVAGACKFSTQQGSTTVAEGEEEVRPRLFTFSAELAAESRRLPWVYSWCGRLEIETTKMLLSPWVNVMQPAWL